MKCFVVCPFGVRTGGPKALHQLHFALRSLGIESFLWRDQSADNSMNPQVVQEYEKYNPVWVEKLYSSDEDIWVIPETRITEKIWRTFPGKKVIWWLSVNNSRINPSKKFMNEYFPRVLPDWNRPKSFRDKYGPRAGLNKLNSCLNSHKEGKIHGPVQIDSFMHITQSRYAQIFLREDFGINSLMVSDYVDIKSQDLARSDEANVNQTKFVETPIIIFNPNRGGYYIELISSYLPGYEFVPLAGYTHSEVQNLMNKATLYLDMGNFPGKDRMPREAALASCPVMIANQGAGRVRDDFPLNQHSIIDMSFETPELVASRILQTIKSKKSFLKNQSDFKHAIEREESIFESQVTKFISFLD